MMAPGRQPRVITGRHVFVAIAAFFLVVFAVNGVFLYVSLDSHPGVTTDDAYRKGLKYNRELEEADRQRALGWQGTVTLDGGSVAIRLSDRDGEPLHGVNVSVECRRPATDLEDRTYRLRETGPGVYGLTQATLPSGRWILRFHISDVGGKRMRIDETVMVKR